MGPVRLLVDADVALAALLPRCSVFVFDQPPQSLQSLKPGPRNSQVIVSCSISFIIRKAIRIYIEALCAAPPEALAHSRSQMPLSCPVLLPKRQMPLSCPVAPPYQRGLHKDGGGGGGGVVGRARAARAPGVLRNVLRNALLRVLKVLAAAAAVVVVREGGPVCRRRRAPVTAHARTRGSTRRAPVNPSAATGRWLWVR